MTTVVLHMPIEEVELFKSFRQHQDTFSLLVNSGIFNIHRGEAKVFFGEGVIRDIDVSVNVYKRNSENPQVINVVIDNRSLPLQS